MCYAECVLDFELWSAMVNEIQEKFGNTQTIKTTLLVIGTHRSKSFKQFVVILILINIKNVMTEARTDEKL